MSTLGKRSTTALTLTVLGCLGGIVTIEAEATGTLKSMALNRGLGHGDMLISEENKALIGTRTKGCGKRT